MKAWISLAAIACLACSCSGTRSAVPPGEGTAAAAQQQQNKAAGQPAVQAEKTPGAPPAGGTSPVVEIAQAEVKPAPAAAGKPKAAPEAPAAGQEPAEEPPDEEPAEGRVKVVGTKPATPPEDQPAGQEPTAEDLMGKEKPEIEVVGGDIRERERISELYVKAREYYATGNLYAARSLLERVRKGQPYHDMAQRFLKVIAEEIDRHREDVKFDKELLDLRDRTVQRMFREAEKAYNTKQYSRAVDLLDEAYLLNPEEPRVRSLRADARIARANEDMLDNSANQDARIAESMSDIERLGTVPRELPRAPRPAAKEQPQEDQDQARILEEKLNQKVSANLDATPLDYLLNILFRGTGVNIVAKPEDLEGKAVTLHVEEIKLIDLLDYISKTLGVNFTRAGNAIWMTGGGDVQAGPMMKWRVIPLNKGLIDVSKEEASTDSDLEKLLKELPNIIDWPTGSQYYLDRKTNSIFVRTTSESMEQLVELVNTVDVTPVQVLIETKFIEITSKDFSDLGIEWKTTSDLPLTKKDGMNNLQIDSGMGVSLPAPVAAGSVVPETAGFDAILAGVMTVPQFQLTLHALKATGHTSTLGEPRLIAVNNSTASMDIVRDMYYVSDYEIDRQLFDGSSFSSTTDTLGNVIPGQNNQNLNFAAPIIVPKYEKTDPIGFKLKVTPSVGKDLKDITLALEPEITDLVEMLKTSIAVGAEGGQPLQVEQPIISKRTLKAKLTVSDGYVVVLGGLARQTKEKGQVKVPILGDIPLLGLLFKHDTEKNVKSNLLIFVSAKILTSEGRMYVGAGPGDLGLGTLSTAERVRQLRERIEVEVP